MQPIRLRGHHLSNLAEYMFGDILPQESGMNRHKYGEAHIEKVKKLYHTITRNPETRIVLVDTIDSVCEADCKYRQSRDDCESAELSAQDREEIEAYGLQLGETTSKEVTDKIREFGETHVVPFGTLEKHIHSYSFYKFLKTPMPPRIIEP